jgi:RNA polymerase sigma factor (TIGR02999 family)
MPTELTISELIAAAERGEHPATEALFSALYAELQQLAHRLLARHGGPASLGASTLLHEAYLDIAARDPSFPDRARFMGYAARVMRGLIIDQARSRRAQKRGGRYELTTFDTSAHEGRVDDRELARVGAALDELAESDPDLAQIVDLKFFCGFTFAEIAAMRGVSERTVKRSWEKARIFLYRGLRS